MAHKFVRTTKDPYAETAHQVERHLEVSRTGMDAGADDQLFDTLSDAIVVALGDVGAEAFRRGLNDPEHMKRLAKAIAGAAETVLLSYQGEVDPEPALRAIEGDDRINGLAPEARDKLQREVLNTRQLEGLVLHAKRLPQLINLAGSLGLRVQEDVVDQGEILVPGRTQS